MLEGGYDVRRTGQGTVAVLRALAGIPAGAETLPDDVSPEVKQERRARLLTAQQRIVAERLQAEVGRTVEVLVEGAHPETEHLLVGRLATQAPDVDGCVLLNDGPAVRPGTFARVELTDVAGYDLVGRILDGP